MAQVPTPTATRTPTPTMSQESHHEDPLSSFLDSILADPSSELSPDTLHALSDQNLVDYSLLILSLLAKQSTHPQSHSTTAALHVFLNRLSTNRSLKLSVALLTNLGQLKHNLDAHFTFASKNVLPDSSIPPPNPSVPLQPRLLLDTSTSALQDYVSHRFFHPRFGISLKTKTRNLGLRTYPNAFSKQLAILFLLSDLAIDKDLATLILHKMIDEKYITRVSKATKETGFGNDVYVRAPHSTATIPGIATTTTGTDTSCVPPRFQIPMDALDLQSLYFWRDTLWEKSPLQEGYQFNTTTVVHPIIQTNNNEHPLIQNITVLKVFPSMAKPAFLKLSAYREGAIIHTNNPDELAFQEILPRVIAKNGDNLLNDACVELLFRIFSHVWKTDFEPDQAPFSYDYPVLPCGPRVGLLGVLDSLQPLNDFDWKTWAITYKDNPQVLDTMCRSAAGCSIATYVLGCGDRHWDNIQIQNHTTMLHIDFGMILGENPAFKTPRFSISAGQEAAFRNVGIWEPFVDLCGQAYVSLRRRAPALMNLTSLVLQQAGRPQSKILKYLASPESFHLEQEHDDKAELLVTRQVRESSTHWETIARKFTHNRIDPLFFKAVEKAPASLVAAVEKMYDKN